MGTGSRLRARGEEIEFDTEEGKKKYKLMPMKNKELLEVVELADKKAGMKSAILMAKFCLNRDPKIVEGVEKPFTDEDMDEMDSPFLLQILKVAAKINGLEEMYDFQQRVEKTIPSPPTAGKLSYQEAKDLANSNPVKKL